MQKRRFERTVWIDRVAFGEFVRSVRSFPFMVHPRRSEYVKDHQDSLIPVKIPFEYEIGEKERSEDEA